MWGNTAEMAGAVETQHSNFSLFFRGSQVYNPCHKLSVLAGQVTVSGVHRFARAERASKFAELDSDEYLETMRQI
jgi:hypothetical protein